MDGIVLENYLLRFCKYEYLYTLWFNNRRLSNVKEKFLYLNIVRWIRMFVIVVFG